MNRLILFLLAALAFVFSGRGAPARPREANSGKRHSCRFIQREATRASLPRCSASLGPAANLPYPAGHILALQICLDRRNFSVNALDGTTGRKTDVALATYCAVNGIPFPERAMQAKAWEELFPGDRKKYIYPPGPNNPVGLAWIGLSLPTYGIHGTPWPEQIGRAESHGCFRLSNWNAVRLRELCDVGTSVVIE